MNAVYANKRAIETIECGYIWSLEADTPPIYYKKKWRKWLTKMATAKLIMSEIAETFDKSPLDVIKYHRARYASYGFTNERFRTAYEACDDIFDIVRASM